MYSKPARRAGGFRETHRKAFLKKARMPKKRTAFSISNAFGFFPRKGKKTVISAKRKKEVQVGMMPVYAVVAKKKEDETDEEDWDEDEEDWEEDEELEEEE
jgi:hypothetical protein